jgi:hypothetical protein
MKKTNSNTIFYFEPKKKYTKYTTIDIEFENKKSLELYNKFNTKPRFSILEQKIIINQPFTNLIQITTFVLLAIFVYF